MNYKLLKILSISFMMLFSMSSCFNNSNNEGDKKEDTEQKEEKEDICNHEYVKEVTKAGDCLHKEEITYTCNKCKDSYVEEGNYGEHSIKDEFIKDNSDSKGTSFTKISRCSICNEVIDQDKVRYKDHHYILESDDGRRAIYKCIICDDTIEYEFDINDFEYYLDGDLLKINNYTGTKKNIYIPSNLIVNNKKISYIEGLNISNNKYIERLKLSSNFNNTSYSNTIISSNTNLKYINLKDTLIYVMDRNNIYPSNSNLGEIIFPDSLLFYWNEHNYSSKIDTLDFSNTDLEYLSMENGVLNRLVLPSTIKFCFFYNCISSLKDVIVKSEDILGSLYGAPICDSDWTHEYLLNVTKYKKDEEFNVNVNLIYPNGVCKKLKLPHGANLFKTEEYLNLLKEDNNKKIGWYKEKTCFDYFFGILPTKDITLYGMYLDDMDETFLNKHQFLYEPEHYLRDIKVNSLTVSEKIYKLDDIREVVSLLYYMLSNDIQTLYVDVDNLNHLNYDSFVSFVSGLCGIKCDRFYHIFSTSHGIYNVKLNQVTRYTNNILKIYIPDYESTKKQRFDLENVVQVKKFDYTSPFKDFDYRENNRAVDFDDFKYQDYEYVKKDVTNPTIMSYMMSVGIKVIPKEGSLAESTLKTYKNIARNIFNDSMSDYDKIVACNRYIGYYTYDDKNVAYAYNKNGNGAFLRLLEEIPKYGTTVCTGATLLPRMLYALEGIQMFDQESINHIYGVIKLDNKWYVSDHTGNLNSAYDNSDIKGKLLRGFLDLHVDDSYKYIVRNISYAYPGIELEKYHYEP